MAGRMPTAARGRVYYDADKGRRMIRPREGGKAVPYVGPRQGFDARRTLRRTGVAGRDLGSGLLDDAARGATAVASRSGFEGGAALAFGVTVAAGLLGLIFIDLLLSDRGSRATVGILDSARVGIRKLIDPGDPIFGADARQRASADRGNPGGGGGASSADPPPRPSSSTPAAFSPDEWGGSKTIADEFASIARRLGLSVTSEKRATRNTASGGISDHWVGSRNAYAYDLSNGSAPTPEMDRAAIRIMAALGQGYDGKSELVRNVNVNGYRVQVLYRTAVGGNHYDHIHVGVRKL